MSLFGKSLYFFGYRECEISDTKLKSLVNVSDLGDNAKNLSIFNKLDVNKDKVLDENEIRNIFTSLELFAKQEKENRDISLNEMNAYILSLFGTKQAGVGESSIKSLDIYNFINNYILEKPNITPRNLLIKNLISNGAKIDIDISTDIDKATFLQLENCLKDYTDKFNLLKNGVDNENSAFLKDMQQIVDLYLEEYGSNLNSTSRESLLSGKIFPDSSAGYDAVRDGSGITKSNADWQAEKLRIKENNFANCGESQNMVLEILRNNFDNYECSAINIRCKINSPVDMGYEAHCAVLVKDDCGEEYVIDMWLNPKEGAVYKRQDWEKLVKEIYMTHSYKIEVNNEFLEAIQN
jgi:hypothetical protein